MRLGWPLTGRSEEMRLIEGAIFASGISGIVICGAAGVGKSRIAREALTSASSKGCATHWASGTAPARGVPLGAFAAWTGSGVTDTLQLVTGVIDSLTTASARTTVVGVDDANLLDDLSVFVLQQLVQRRAAKLVLTVRDSEPIPGWTHELWRHGEFDRLDLQPLSHDETAMLISAAVGGSVDPDAARRLWKLTRGNVLYLRNIVEQEVGDGRLVHQHGYWRWLGEPNVAPGLVELVESRIGALPASVSDVIDALAVGEPIELASLKQIADPAAVEDADMLGLLTLDRDDEGRVEVRVAHPLYGEVRRKRAAPTRLRRLRGLVAAELAASSRSDDIRLVVRRAALSLDSDLEQDPDLLVRAAQGAVSLSDLPLADQLAEAAIRAGAGAEAHFVRAYALSWLSRGREADSVLCSIPTSELAEADRDRFAFLQTTNRLFTLADRAGAKRLIDEAARATSSGHNVCVDACRRVYWAAMGKPEAATESSETIAWERLPDLAARMTAWAIAVASGDAGRTGEAAAAANRGYTVLSRSIDGAPAPVRFVVADGHVGALLQSGRICEAVRIAEQLRQHAVDLPGTAQPLSVGVAGRAALAGGRLTTACALLQAAAELLSGCGEANGWGYRYQLPRTIALAMSGSTAEAAAALTELEKRRHPSWRFLDYELALARAWVAAAQGAVSEAVTVVLTAARNAAANRQFAAEVMCLQTATQLGNTSGAARLRELTSIVEGPRVALAARYAAALRSGDGAELASVSDEFERMGDLVAALDAAAHAVAAYRRQGLRGSALGPARHAEALAEQCGRAKTPALGEAVDQLPLTAREREVVMLIGNGTPSRAVAARLSVSVRTVEGHIYRAMAKTGVSNRDELAALLPKSHA